MRALTSPAPATSALLLASILASLIAVGAFTLSAWADYTNAVKGAERLSQQVARLLEEHTQRYVSAPEQALRRLDDRFADLPVTSLGSDKVRRTAEDIATELPQVSSLFIANADGKVVMLTGDPNRTAINVADRAYFRAHMVESRKDTVVGPLILSREPQPRYAFTVSIPLIRAGKAVGIIAATLDVKFFSAFYDSLGLEPGAVCAVFNDQGWLVVRQRIDPQYVTRNYAHLPLFTERLPQAPTGTYMRVGDMDGVERVFSYRKVAGLPLVVNAGLPWRPLITDWQRHQMNNAALMLALLSVVQAALWLTWRGVLRERTLAAGLQRALDDNVTLFNEIHHRVKNNMQIVSSMLMIEQIRAGQGALAERLQLVADRVSSMALVHTMLYERQEASRVDISAYLTELCRNLAEGHGATERGIAIEVTADGSRLAMDHAVPLGLLVNEAVSNALKHAFPQDRTGIIRVAFTGDGGDSFVLSVSDDGTGLPAQPKGTGIGTTIMRSLAGQLDGDTTLSNRPDGPGTVLHVWRGMPQPVMAAQRACA
ncbi:MAG: ATP-binding protein [Rhodospirillaceae bacterium]|nr:ATP-binding protein [Rhodospirillales bacterium]